MCRAMCIVMDIVQRTSSGGVFSFYYYSGFRVYLIDLGTLKGEHYGVLLFIRRFFQTNTAKGELFVLRVTNIKGVINEGASTP